MAQKQFKIGLSNNDKQNMAQDVYERVLALTFNEYDTTTEYEVGDFVVYNDQLYKCISATSGAWDSSKWQLATLNDLVGDIENAVQFVNDKANVDGNYPTMTVGVADNLSPYDDEAGIKQSAPFNFQASGTNNGADPTATVGELALLQEKQGNTVVVNQLVQNPTFNGTTNWETSGNATISASDNILTIESGEIYNGAWAIAHQIKGHKYLLISQIKCNKNTTTIQFGVSDDTNYTSIVLNQTITTSFAYYTGITTIDTDVNAAANKIFIRQSDNSTGNEIQVKTCYLVDLTQWFNGDIPQDLLDHPEHFFRYYQGSLAYNEGTLVNANGRYLKTIGRNQWDEEWELGNISSIDGQNFSYDSSIRSKNYIRVIPNETYHCKAPQTIYIRGYDKDKNYTGFNGGLGGDDNVIIPSDVCYIRFVIDLTTYNNDITISIYYDDESGYDQYYPYEELANIDTGTEVLRSAGSVKDSKAPDGTITRRVGVVDLGTLEWTYNNTNNYYTSTSLRGLAKCAVRDGVDIANLSCDTAVPTFVDDVYLGNYGIGVQSDGTIFFKNGNTNSTTAPTGTLYYELATPTTEQGTSFSENVAINDFGSMDFGGTNGVPQGALIFYPVDYKAYLDTLHKYTDGDPDNLALNSELNAKFESYLKSLSGYNASETQVLKNISGTFTWVTEGE